VTQIGDTPHLEKLIGPIKVMLDAYQDGQLDAVYLCYTKFINTMKQEPVVEQLLPLPAKALQADKGAHAWDYIYEPDAQVVIDELLVRYVEALIYQAVAENLASEQSARMVAMKAASDNAGSVIGELKLVYNKTRQAAITKELSEIVSRSCDQRQRVKRPLVTKLKLYLKERTWLMAKSFSVSAQWLTWNSRATRCRRCTTH
jgi:F-type H+-transporting ATPase subunit gamma